MTRRKSYNSVIKVSLGRDKKTAVVALITMGFTPSEACRRLNIPIISYTDAYMNDTVFQNDVDSAKAGLAQALHDKIYQDAMNGDLSKAELWMKNYARYADEKDPFRWVNRNHIEDDEKDNINATYKDYLNKLFEAQFERLNGGDPDNDDETEILSTDSKDADKK